MFSPTFVKGSFVTSLCLLAAAACGGGMETGGLSGSTPSNGVADTAAATPAPNAATAPAGAAGNANIAAGISADTNAIVNQVLGALKNPAVQAALGANPNNPNCTKAKTAINTDTQNLETAAQNDNDAAAQADATKLGNDIESLVQACF